MEARYKYLIQECFDEKQCCEYIKQSVLDLKLSPSIKDDKNLLDAFLYWIRSVLAFIGLCDNPEKPRIQLSANRHAFHGPSQAAQDLDNFLNQLDEGGDLFLAARSKIAIIR